MSRRYSEDALQAAVAEFWSRELGWEQVRGRELGRSSEREVVLVRELRGALTRLNPWATAEELDAGVRELTRINAGLPLVEINRALFGMIRDGVLVETVGASGEKEARRLRVIDFDEPEQNRFRVVRELWVQGRTYRRRADMVGFVNGLPLVFVEMKSILRDVKLAFEDNYRDYRDTIPALFYHNALVMVSNGEQSRVGTITSRWEHFLEWKRLEENDPTPDTSIERMLRGLCERRRFLDVLESFILFDNSAPGATWVKVLGRNHQVLGVNRAFEAVREREARRGKLGIFWHTQGSGKSYSLAFLARKVLRKLSGAMMFLIVTDRTELDDQIVATFAGIGAVSSGGAAQASSGTHLQALLAGGGSFVFTTIQKFDTTDPGPWSTRSDLVVLVDEAHRTQNGKLAEAMRRLLPEAAFLAFTGTPLRRSEEDQATRKMFGDYVSVYGFQHAIEDGATVPLYYDARGDLLQIANPKVAERVAEELGKLTLDPAQEAKLQRLLRSEYPILTALARLQTLADDLVAHLALRWQTGKAMLVCLDKVTCVKMYELLRERWDRAIVIAEAELDRNAPPDPADAELAQERLKWLRETEIRVIVSEDQNEVATFKQARESDPTWPWVLDIEHHRRVMKAHKNEAEFKDPRHPFRLVIVCAMWLTGFDVPSLATLYLDKPMKGHTLMQAIARANRVHQGKDSGLLVDYNGMFQSLKDALAVYGAGGKAASEELPGELEQELWAQGQEKLAQELADAVQAVVDALGGWGFDIAALVAAAPLQTIRLLDERRADSVVNLICQEAGRREQFRALVNVMRRKRRALTGSPALITPLLATIEAIELIARRLERQVTAADLTSVLLALYSQVGEDIATLLRHAPGGASGTEIDLSALDLERLRDAFARAPHPHTIAAALQLSAAQRLTQAVQRNPTRASLYERYLVIIEEYNRAKDRASIELLVEALGALLRDLGEEEQRHVREGLSEEELAIVDLLLLNKAELPAKTRDRVKEVGAALLALVHARLALLADWRARETAQTEIKLLIHNFLYSDETGLPMDGYGEDEIEGYAQTIFTFLLGEPSANTDMFWDGVA